MFTRGLSEEEGRQRKRWPVCTSLYLDGKNKIWFALAGQGISSLCVQSAKVYACPMYVRCTPVFMYACT